MDGGRGNDVMHGGDGDDRMFGGDGDDVLSGGAGDDVLKGGEGNDLFIFNGGGGSDLILDFEEGHDLVRIEKGINGLDIHSASDLAAHVSQDGANAVVDLGGDTITLVGVSADDIQHDPSKFFQVV
jgi:Ca2+-binding RTX toxin-like protein